MAAAMRSEKRPGRATSFGLVSLILWVSTVGIGRDLLESIGPLFGSSLTFLLSGAFLIAVATLRCRGLGWWSRISKRHLWICGPFFVAYLGLFYVALGIAADRQQAVLVGLVNYFWPTWIVLLAIPLQKMRPRFLLFGVGVVLGLVGVAFAASVSAVGADGSWSTVAASLIRGWAPLTLAGAGSVAWGVYSNLAKRVPQTETPVAVGLLMVAAGCILLVPALIRGEAASWSLRAVMELVYLAGFPTAVGYTLWDRAMRDGNITLLGSVSNLLPLASVALAGALLGIPLHGRLIAGAAAVAAGSLACHRSLQRDGSAEMMASKRGMSDSR